MKRIIIIFYFLLSTFYVNSQVVFNNAYDTLGSRTTRSIVLQENNYFTVGGNTQNNRLGIVVCKFDLGGEVLETKFYGDTCSWYHGAENSLQATGTGNYILAGNIEKGLYGANLLVKFDSNFDTIFTKRYNSVYDINNCGVINYNSCVGNDGNYTMIGYTNMTNNNDTLDKIQIQLIKTDTLGNLLWRKLIGDTINEYAGYKIINSFEGGYIIGGWCEQNGGDWCVVKVDENGENPIFKNFGHSYYDDGRVGGITALSDSTYVITGRKMVDFENGRARVLKLDRNLDIVWDSLYGKATPSTEFMKCIEKENKDLVFSGNYKNFYSKYIATITRMDSVGNLLWQKETGYLDTMQTGNTAMDIKETPDGGYVFTGWVFSSTLTPPQQMWLVKTDSLGCDGTEFTCGVTQIPEFSVQNNERGLIIYPNPAKNILFLEINKEQLIINNNNTPNNKVQTLNKGRHCERSVAIPIMLTKEQFQELSIQEKLKYSSKNPKNTFWGEKERQQMREIQQQYAYMLPFKAINGKVDIFSIDPALAMQVRAKSKKLKVESFTAQNSNVSEFPLRKSGLREIDISIYDIFGRLVKTNVVCHTGHCEVSRFSITVSDLQKEIYIVKIGEYSAKFVKE